MTPAAEVEAFLQAMKDDGFGRADELADLMLQYCLTDNSHAIEAGDKIREAMRMKHLPLRARARRVVAVLQQHIATFPAEH
jgi:NTP pyrophosphatase (non-canonical NTP hydrolase)